METVACKSCKTEINKEDKVCPKCGFPNKQSNIISSLVRIIITLTIVGYFFGESIINWFKDMLNI